MRKRLYDWEELHSESTDVRQMCIVEDMDDHQQASIRAAALLTELGPDSSIVFMAGMHYDILDTPDGHPAKLVAIMRSATGFAEHLYKNMNVDQLNVLVALVYSALETNKQLGKQ